MAQMEKEDFVCVGQLDEGDRIFRLPFDKGGFPLDVDSARSVEG